jgi:hypothetical protein
VKHSEKDKITTISIAIIAIVAARTLLGVVAITVVTIPIQQQADAAGRGNPGCFNTPGLNASKGRCFHP